MNLIVSEIMSSLQGEGKYTGQPTTFIRLFGCNLRCSFCDAKYSYDKTVGWASMTIETIVKIAKQEGNKIICLTGGEPLIQEGAYELVNQLIAEGFKVTIETNGAVQIPEIQGRKFSYCMDIKCPSSGMEEFNKYENLLTLTPDDEVKFVIKHWIDYEFAKTTITTIGTDAQVIFSPVFKDSNHNGALIAEWMLEDGLHDVKLGLQMHKLLGIY